ncbi:MAG: chromosome segregation protein SMC [Azospirillaceae bacterium]
MQFNKLRLTGFKSFVDPTELVVEAGITGVVGPNGCGKSNLVEALRWVMGENSAKRMRGSEMDDVIFGGTSDRPSRNLAEVSLHLDNSARTAPAAFNHADDLEISRRIERGSGSDYRINGKSVRARDVQLLFQDHGSGAHSPALVSQGRVSTLINAKATDRRMLLEEAAGITGLHSRRHEAELRLKAAEENLTRLEDVIQAMDTQLQGLKKQARQAARYRSLSDRIRTAEATVLHLERRAAEHRLATARQGHADNEAVVRERMLAVTRATTAQEEAAGAVPPLRQGESEAAAALQRLVHARDQLDAEEKRIAAERAEAERRRDQGRGDVERERGLAADAETALARLSEERERLAGEQGGEAEAEAAARAALDEARAAVEAAEGELETLTRAVAEADAERAQLDKRLAELDRRHASLAERLERTRAERDRLDAELGESPDLDAAARAVTEAETALADARGEAEAAERRRSDGAAAEQAARVAQQAAAATLARLEAEADGLRSALGAGQAGDMFPPLIDAVSVEQGYESAFGAALGDDAEVPLDEAAPVFWRALPPLDGAAALPRGAEPLGDRVRAPGALARRLAHVGVVADGEAGERLAPELAPGQVLVDRDGAVWRWDGLVARAGAPSPAAARLQQRNRLAELARSIERARAEAEARESEREVARATAREAADAAETARGAVDAAFGALESARSEHAALDRRLAEQRSKRDGLDETVATLEAEQAGIAEEQEAGRAARAELEETGERRARIAELRAELAEARGTQGERQNALDSLVREADARRRRLAAIDEEAASWRKRADGAGERLAELERRASAEDERLAALADRPGEIAGQRAALQERIAEAERARRRAADALAEAESAQAEADRALKAAESALAESREARVRAEGEVSAAKSALEGIDQRIRERLEVEPDRVMAVAGLSPQDDLPELAAMQSRLERLLRERDTMGPVNLRAETEAAELDEQIAGMHTERDDLIAAIGRLRQGISSLNREARERLLASFETVDGHFQSLFVRLFGGGKARLELTDSEDPLAAGLEIYASPPGKRLQHLSLLSGGEQALTAIALLFAVFMTNPAPICVLDEVDAPLDDANVDRFCTLLDELAHGGVTRFLIVTHHRMTMARADRLYGVTMPERGVSQLVSVDLENAERLRRTA